ncbi:hypothetical protein EV122DRAFT_265827 [Schizophyllum commune]
MQIRYTLVPSQSISAPPTSQCTMEAVCRDEAGFGPAASCRAMDFSLGFQYRILAILPAAVFLFLGITRTTDLWRRHSITKSALDALVCVKLTLYAVLLASLAATLGLLPRDGWAEWATTAFGLELAATVRARDRVFYCRADRSFPRSSSPRCRTCITRAAQRPAPSSLAISCSLHYSPRLSYAHTRIRP